MGAETTHMAFLERYPYFSFLLSVTPFTPREVEEEGRIPFATVQADLLYLFGLGHYAAAEEWLEGAPHRQIVFLEHDLAAIAAGLEGDQLDRLFSNPRAHLCFSLERKGFAEEVATLFPAESIAVLASPLYKLKYRSYFAKLKNTLIRASVLSAAHRQERLHYHRLFGNMVPNFLSLEEAFSPHKMAGCFAGVPAIIVGAGPSLAEAIPHLRKLQDRALIFAGGSSIIALGKQGIAPHFGFAIDPNREEYTRLKQSRFLAMPLIFGSRLMPQVLSVFGGPRGYVKTSTGGPFEAWMEEQLELEGESLLTENDNEALSVTIIAVKTAILFGCNPIIFAGMDLAYRNQERYCKDILPSMTLALEKDHLAKRTGEVSLVKKGRKGVYVETAYKWIMESRCLAGIAARNPQVTFLDTTTQGLAIEGVPHRTFEEIDFSRKFSLEEMCHTEITRATLALTKEKIQEPLLCLKQSLEVVRNLLEEIERDPEHPRSVVLELDLKQELAYTVLLRTIEGHAPITKEVVDAYLEVLCL